MRCKIAILPGDGIGGEIIPESIKVLNKIGLKFEHEFLFDYGNIGGNAIDKMGVPLPTETLKLCEDSDAILFGAVGGPKWDDMNAKYRPEDGILSLRKSMELFANLRPVKIFPALISSSPLKSELIGDVDMVIVRELTGGLYFSQPKKRWVSDGQRYGVDTLGYSESEIDRILRVGFELAKTRRSKLTSADKANVLETDYKASAILIVGVNGTGKTTSAAKLAAYYTNLGKSVMLIGADTYRAAAAEQLRQWSVVANIQFVSNESSGDPSAVLFDGLKSAQAKDIDISLIDTAGRLHTYKNLMAEIGKMHKVVTTKFPDFQLETLLTLDANLGQNSLSQAKKFHEQTSVDGIILTKMDGTAKGGIVFPIYRELGIPVKFIGMGETLDDLIEFNAEDYVQSLIG